MRAVLKGFSRLEMRFIFSMESDDDGIDCLCKLTTVSRNVVSVFEISAVNLVVG